MQLPERSRSRVLDEYGRGRLPDARLEWRLRSLGEALAVDPSRSIPDVMGDEAALEGAYRFLNNGRVSFEAIHEEHAARTRQRAEEEGSVLAIHDTSTFSFPHAVPDEVGYLPTGKAGFFGHFCLLAVMGQTPRPLGVAHAETTHRAQRTTGRGRHVQGSQTSKIQDREFRRWFRGFDACQDLLHDVNEVVHVMDSEGDAFSLMQHMLSTEGRFVVRACHDRATSDDGTRLSEVTRRADANVVFRREVALSKRSARREPRERHNKRRPPRPARTATLSVSATSATFRAPRYVENSSEMSLNVVHVFEKDPPKGEVPIDWVLLTTEPIERREDVERVVDIYRCRWLVEEFFKAIKTGCAYKFRQFETKHALLNLLAVLLPIAVEVLWLRARARDTPDASADEIFSATQLRILRVMSSRKLPANPTVEQAVWALAAIAGHRRSNGPPGWQILTKALAEFQMFEAGWSAAIAAQQSEM